jgi:four helix bundle protein
VAGEVSDHKGLIVWQKARVLVKEIYTKTSGFPASELYGLTSQMRRAAVSIPANIAEGAGRGSTKEYAHFISIATGSAVELETHLFIAHDLGFLNEANKNGLEDLLNEVLRMLKRMREALRKKMN